MIKARLNVGLFCSLAVQFVLNLCTICFADYMKTPQSYGPDKTTKAVSDQRKLYS